MWMFLTVNIMTVVGLPCYYLYMCRGLDYSDFKGFIVWYIICVASLIIFDLLLILS